MSTGDFIKSLQEEDVIFSDVPPKNMRVIPPEDESYEIQPTNTKPKVENKIKKEENISQTQPIPNQIPTHQEVHVDNTSIPQPYREEYNEETQVLERQKVEPREAYRPNQIVEPIEEQPRKDVQSHPIKEEQVYQVQPKPIQQKEQYIEEEKEEYIPEPQLPKEEELFMQTGTEISKKTMWMQYYQKALNSRKDNNITRKMKIGRFTITPDNKILILPDYDVVNKDPDDIIKDKWF